MAWNSYSPLSYDQYKAIVGDSPLADTESYIALTTAAQQQNRDPRAMLVQLAYENDYGRNISQSQLSNNNFAGIKYAGQAGASPGGKSPEGDQYAAFDSIGSFMSSLASSLGWYIAAFPSRNTMYNQLVSTYPPGSAVNPNDPGVINVGKNANSGGGFNPFGAFPSASDIGNAVGKGVSTAIGNALGAATGRAGSIVKGILSSDLVERGALILAGFIMIIAGLFGLANKTGVPQAAAMAAAA